jgi:hypothetical protein
MNTLQAYRSIVLSRIVAAFAAAILAAGAVALPNVLLALGSVASGTAAHTHAPSSVVEGHQAHAI